MKNILVAFNALPYYWSKHYWKRNLTKIISTFLSIFGILWLFIETANHFNIKIAIPDTTPFSYSMLLLCALLLAVIYNIPKLTHEVEIADTDIKIELIVANYLNLPGDKVIATNSTYDTTFENNFISPKSIQGQFFKKFYKNLSHLDNDLEKSLENETPILVLDRTKSKTKQFNIGTVAKVQNEEFMSYWLAMADVNEFGKPNSNFENLQISLIRLWEFIATKGHLENLVIPILGSGRTGINEKRERILQEIIFSFVAFATEKKLTEKLTIAIHPKDILKHNMNFYELCTFLEHTCKHKSSKNFGRSQEI